MIKKNSLPKYVGYAEVEQALGIGTRTIQRMVRQGRFPKPEQLAPNRVGWREEVVMGHLDKGKASLASAAVLQPDKLKPEQLAPTMRDLAARMVAEKVGEPVRPEQITLHIQRKGDGGSEEIVSVRGELFGWVEDLCRHFTRERALYVAASCFPAIHKQLLKSGFLSEELRDPELLREFATDILDDEYWAEIEKISTEAEQPESVS
jgi:predicted DNA-binding transcriptional regulator AlpA